MMKEDGRMSRTNLGSTREANLDERAASETVKNMVG